MTVTVRFTGICSHYRLMGGPHRVTLVRAENGAYINGSSVPPHIPKLIVRPEDVVRIEGYPYGLEAAGGAGSWRLCGVQLQLKGGVEKTLVHDETYENEVPHLRRLTKESPGLSGEVTGREEAACYFDLDAGRLSAVETEGGAISTELTLETSETPALHVTCFWNRKTCVIHLRPNATIEVEHTGYQHGDYDNDFLLHYRMLSYVPDDAKIPPKPKTALRKIPGNISIGCSNSQYP